MKIPSQTLVDFVPQEKLCGLSIAKLVGIVQQIYCNRMTVKDLCTQDCQNCKARIVGAIRLENAKNNEALLTWLMKSAVAQAQEEEHAKKGITRRKDSIGIAIPTSETPFEDILREISA